MLHQLTNFSVDLDGLENAFVDVGGEDATHRPVVDPGGEEELVGTRVGTIRPSLHIVILTIVL